MDDFLHHLLQVTDVLWQFIQGEVKLLLLHVWVSLPCTIEAFQSISVQLAAPPPATDSRSLEITQSTLQPEIASSFPPSMSFRNLTLDVVTEHGSALSVLDLF